MTLGERMRVMTDDNRIDLSMTVHDICTKHPEIMKMMTENGFKEMAAPGMLQTAGRFMTIPKGAKMKGIDLEIIKQNIRDLGFQIME